MENNNMEIKLDTIVDYKIEYKKFNTKINGNNNVDNNKEDIIKTIKLETTEPMKITNIENN